MSRDNIVGIVTCHRLDGSRLDSQWGHDFLHPYRPALSYPTSYILGTGSFSGVKQPRYGVDHPLPSSAKVIERVKLYLCSPSGASWPVLG
jgi:hypothetical protein